MKLLSNRSVFLTALLYLFCSLFSPTYGQVDDGVPDKGNPDREAHALFYNAMKARMTDDEKRCDSILQVFIKTFPDEPAAYYELARLNMQPNANEKAVTYIKKAIALDGKNKWYRSQYAEILISLQKYADAADIYMQLAKEEPHNEDYLSKAASLYQHEKKYDEALKAIDKLLEKTGNDEEVLLQKEQVYVKNHDYTAAMKILQKLIEQNPKESRYYHSLGALYDDSKQYDKAVEVYTKAQDLFPNDATIQYALAQHYKTVNDTAKYHEYVKKAIVNKDLDVESQLALLEEYVRDNDTIRKKEIVQLVETLAMQHLDNAQVQRVFADILLIDNQTEKAIQQYKLSLALDPSKLAVWDRLLRVYTDRIYADSLIMYSEKAIRLFPNQATMHYMNGIGYLNKKNYTKSINSINRAIDLQPEEEKETLEFMYATLGDVCNLNKQFTQSDTAYERSLKLNPKNPSVLNNYSYNLSERGIRLDAAESMSKKSLEIRPNEPTFLDTYGWILYKQGKFEKAKEYIQKAINLNLEEADATLFEHLGDVYFKLKDVDKAIEYWKMAKQKGSENPMIDKKIQDKTVYE